METPVNHGSLEDRDVDDFAIDHNLVEEAEEIKTIVVNICHTDGQSAAGAYERFKQIVSKYQEQPQLLDAYIEGIVNPLAAVIRKHANTPAGCDMATTLAVCRLLYVLVVVRGYKTTVKFFPHETRDLENVLNLLQRMRGEGPGETWEGETVLLLWLSILILVPFDLATVDSAVQVQGGRPAGYTQLAASVLDMCKAYLSHPGVPRDMAALLLARLLTRPDMPSALREFIDWSEGQLAKAEATQFLVTGILQSVAFIFKLGLRQSLLVHTPRVWQLHQRVQYRSVVLANTLARKLVMKLCQRLGMTFLPPRLAPWRYTQQAGDLAVNLAMTTTAADRPVRELLATAHALEVSPSPDHMFSHPISPSDSDAEEVAVVEEEDVDVPEEVEEVLEQLLTGLSDGDTVVRWSAAKGVGRITGSLPQALGDDVVKSVLGFFDDVSDTAWHGACLAVAELARRGLLLPEHLPALVPRVQEALMYDKRRGPHSVGAHVRDAAAYVCWAMARAYAPEVVKDHVTALASSLLTMACYDREVNCRRAAASAFQECVGRLGTFPHGIDILTVADYFTVGNLQQSYLHVAPFVASFPKYTRPLVDHLMDRKLNHWEKSLRELAGKGLALLAPRAPEYLYGEGLEALIERCLHPSLESRHGAVVAVAELVKAEGSAEGGRRPWMGKEQEEQVANLVTSLEAAQLFRGKGGELMREATCQLVEAMSFSGVALSNDQHVSVGRVLDDNVRHPQESIRLGAIRAIRAYTRYYGLDEHQREHHKGLVDVYVLRLRDTNNDVRRGAALALGALPGWLLATRLDYIIANLCLAALGSENNELNDIKSRVNAVEGIGWLVEEVWGPGPPSAQTVQEGVARATTAPPSSINLQDEEATLPQDSRQSCDSAGPGPPASPQLLVDKILPCLFTVMQDYTTDNRGDVGSWLREAAMKVLCMAVPVTLKQLHGHSQEEQGGYLAASLVGVLLKQAVERIARIREVALGHLKHLLVTPELVPYIPNRALVQEALPSEDVQMGNVVQITEMIARLAGLVIVPAFMQYLLEGIAASIGGVDMSLSKAAMHGLLTAVRAAGKEAGEPADESLIGALGAAYLEVWRRNSRSPRLATCLIRTASVLLTRTNIGSVHVAPSSEGPKSQCPSPRTLSHELLEMTRAEARQCSDIPRLLEAASLITFLAVEQDDRCMEAAKQSTMALLVNKYPTVRRHVAESFYLQLLATDPGDNEYLAADCERSCEILLANAWDGDLGKVRAARDELAWVLGVHLPRKEGTSQKTARVTVLSKSRDEYASYQSLIDDFSRGLSHY